jgi:cellulose synthase (UDP-forming)
VRRIRLFSFDGTAIEKLATIRMKILSQPLSSGVRRTRLFSSDDGGVVEKLDTIRMKILKRDPHPEQLATLSIAALKDITHPKQINNSKFRVTGIAFVLVSLFYISWIVENLNKDALWFSLPFLLANLCITISIFISIFNNWNRSTPNLFKIPQGLEPAVAVFIPTYGEPVEMLQKTIESVLQQDWPHESLVIIIGDDGHRPVVQSMVENVQRNYASAQIIYHQPPSKDRPERIGKAKDGNLNSMLKFIEENYSHIQYIETRDADDIVGDPNFLRYTIGHLVSNPKASYVQTIKEAMVGPGDPFGNLQPIFYRGIMLSKHAANAVFPCGSGLVWKRQHLKKIGGFPTWNLVEDLYSGYVALQHGLKGSYLSIVGAVGQTAPEDIPNVYKQLGTWALDSVRLFVWKNPWFVKSLTFRQKMHFTETGLYYLSSFANFIFLITPAICLFSGNRPYTSGNALIFTSFLITYMLIIDLFVLFMGHKVTLQEIWRTKQLTIGMMFVYMKASFLAIMYGARKKPAYKVTRKVQMVGFYFKEVFLQTLLFVFLLSSVICNIWLHHDMLQDIDFSSAIWALLYMVILSGMISKSWYGVKLT